MDAPLPRQKGRHISDDARVSPSGDHDEALVYDAREVIDFTNLQVEKSHR